MIEAHLIFLLMGGAFVAAALAAVAGFGGAAVLLPILVAVFDMREAVPILTVTQLIGNVSRVWFNRDQVELPVVGWFALGSVPAALIGGLLFAAAPLFFLTQMLGIFLIGTVAYRHLRGYETLHLSLRGFAWVGAIFSFLSALLGSVGPLMTPFFLAYGLVKSAYIGTEAFATVVMHVTKLVVYGGTAVLTAKSLAIGLALGPAMILGSFVGKKVLDRLPERLFLIMIEGFLVLAGLGLVIRG